MDKEIDTKPIIYIIAIVLIIAGCWFIYDYSHTLNFCKSNGYDFNGKTDLKGYILCCKVDSSKIYFQKKCDLLNKDSGNLYCPSNGLCFNQSFQSLSDTFNKTEYYVEEKQNANTTN